MTAEIISLSDRRQRSRRHVEKMRGLASWLRSLSYEPDTNDIQREIRRIQNTSTDVLQSLPVDLAINLLIDEVDRLQKIQAMGR